MNKTAIAIYGQAGRGKSATIREVASQLMNAFPNHTLQIINDGGDITYIIEINGVKIGIESQGDPNSRQPRSLADFVAANCDIIICVCRTSGMTRDAVADLHRNHQYEIIWTANHRSWQKNQDQLNLISANEILELIKLIMNGQL
ncbi:hypothetical protein QWY93_15490 [Echinicola jeungdonensis]|uniref:Uncharacterized protein n=1 Tax=Echinicola jeungdonensis TaxID=709343 RepID=A0ABV5J817_9BACT|nr:hypothetical protein [Echinicola jeungdonensis]MDN3670727.1 hypothetical protein [Echinicola jeungdonensis]